MARPVPPNGDFHGLFPHLQGGTPCRLCRSGCLESPLSPTKACGILIQSYHRETEACLRSIQPRPFAVSTLPIQSYHMVIENQETTFWSQNSCTKAGGSSRPRSYSDACNSSHNYRELTCATMRSLTHSAVSARGPGPASERTRALKKAGSRVTMALDKLLEPMPPERYVNLAGLEPL